MNPRDRILILHNTVRLSADGVTPLASDAGVLDEARAVAEALDRLGVPHRTASIGAIAALPSLLAGSDEEIVFNLVEELPGHALDAALVPAICRAHGKSCTGNDTRGILLAQDKWRAKAVLRAAAVPCPPDVLAPLGKTPPFAGFLERRCIVKPALSDASEGIDAAAVVEGDRAALEKAVARVHREFGQPALIEPFVGERELNVSVVERNGKVEVLPIAEISFEAFGEDRPRIVGYEAKWVPGSFEFHNTPRVIPAPLAPAEAEGVRYLALAAWEALDCRDYIRVDFRMGKGAQLHVLEVNPNPDISPDAGFAAALAAARISYDVFIESMIANARRRLARTCCVMARPRPLGASGSSIRLSVAADVEPIVDLLDRTGNFRPNELDIAREVLTDAVGPVDKGYRSFTLEYAGRPAGWVCYGATPCTVGAYDIYWLGVDPDCHRMGFGRLLMKHALDLISEAGGRLAVVETSGRALYDGVRAFYERIGFTEAARVRDFYAPGDDKIIYTLTLKASGRTT